MLDDNGIIVLKPQKIPHNVLAVECRNPYVNIEFPIDSHGCLLDPELVQEMPYPTLQALYT